MVFSITQFSILTLFITWMVQAWFHLSLHQEGRQRFRSCLTWIWWIAVCAVVASVMYAVVSQYHSWSLDPLAQYFLPPHQSIAYFISYSGTRHAANPLIAMAVAIMLGSLAMRLNLKFGGRFLEEEEPRLFALGILLSGYPRFFFYISFMFLFGIALAAWYLISKKRKAPFYFLWLPAAIFAILITNLTLSPPILALFNL